MGKIWLYPGIDPKAGASGLGLEAQLVAIHAHSEQTGAEAVAVYQEIESGSVSDRPELVKSLAHARKAKATLVTAKLDRLARNVAFVSAIMDSGVDFVAVDNPFATRLTLHILAAVAEHEAVAIAQRTKAALAAAKARGVKLGSPVASTTVAAARTAKSAKALSKAQNLGAIVKDIERSGVTTLSGIPRALEARGVQTPSGNTNWQAAQVARVRAVVA
jgi:DNA invertase Pin-like site-specific DNA recombinase